MYSAITFRKRNPIYSSNQVLISFFKLTEVSFSKYAKNTPTQCRRRKLKYAFKSQFLLKCFSKSVMLKTPALLVAFAPQFQ